MKLNKWNEAILDALLSIEKNSAFSKAYTRLITAYTEIKKYHEAIVTFQRAQEIIQSTLNYFE